jgi:hypothetical protein
MSKRETSIGAGKEFEGKIGSCFRDLVSGDGESSGVSKWQLTLSIDELESSDWRERVEGDELRELRVSAVVELARGDRFGIAEDSERYSKPEETSFLLRPAGEDESRVVPCSASEIIGDSEDSKISSVLEIV